MTSVSMPSFRTKFGTTAARRVINGIETAWWRRDLDRIRPGRVLIEAVSRRRHTLAVSSCCVLHLLRHCLHVSTPPVQAGVILSQVCYVDGFQQKR